MDAKAWFSVAVRVVGLLSLGRGVVDLVGFAFAVFGLAIQSSVVADLPTNNVTYGLLYLILGLYLVRGAEWLVNFAFPEKREDNGEDVSLDE